MPQPFPSIIVDNYNGGEVYSIDPTLLNDNQLQKALNVRFRLGGGFTGRPGYYEKSLANFTSVGTAGIQGMFATDNEAYIAANGKIYASLSDLSDAFELITGLDTSADVQGLEFNGDIYFMNGVDFMRKAARTTTASVLVTTTSTSLTVSGGQGYRFGTSGTIRVVSSLGFDDITYTARTDDVLTITAATVGFSHPAGSLVYEISTLSTGPTAEFGAEFKNRFVCAGIDGKSGQKYSGNTLFWSVGATGANPEYFYDFTNTGSGYIPVGDKSDITGIIKTKTYLLIFKKNSIYYLSGFDTTTGQPIIEPLSDVYGTAGKRSFAFVGDQILTFTGKEIKQIGEQENLANTIPSVNPQFDDRIFKYLQSLDEDQSDAVMHYNASQKLLKLWVNKDSVRVCIVLDTNIAELPWSRDTNKPASCVITFKNETFWGSNIEPKIFQDEIGYTDNGFAITANVRTKEWNVGSNRISKYFKLLYLVGLLGENTTVTVDIYFDNVLVHSFELTDTLIDHVGGDTIGRSLIGSGGIAASTESASTGFPFEIEKLLKKRRNTGKMSIEFTANGEGQVFEISRAEINGLYSPKFDRKIRS